MKTVFALLTALFAVILLARADVQAAPISGVSADSNVTLVAGGCGQGFHPGVHGGCVRNLSPRYPCYWVRGPYGRWRMICR
ncbi:MAG TPA: hypothetical protein VHD14_06165 [Pseudolabrys sp.]|jgi:hypothetical protein|nr:hypothetical protein [Pseudolabrys sp.]